jgi:hypothetical protein
LKIWGQIINIPQIPYNMFCNMPVTNFKFTVALRARNGIYLTLFNQKDTSITVSKKQINCKSNPNGKAEE